MHIAFIMDGNGRWATQRGCPRTEGHTKGIETANEIMKACVSKGFAYATFYAFSVQNWSRDRKEIDHIYESGRKLFLKMKTWVKGHNVVVKCIGSKNHLLEESNNSQDHSPKVREAMRQIKQLIDDTKDNTGTVVTLCISYGGREEILEVFQKIQTPLQDLSVKMVSAQFPLPDVDFVIRTSGEYRISNFLLWQSAYAEYYFTETFWPDMTVEELDRALEVFGARQRRFGTVPSAPTERSVSYSIEYLVDLYNDLFAEYKEAVDLSSLYKELVEKGEAFPAELLADEDENNRSKRGGIQNYTFASKGALKIAFELDDIIDCLPMSEQIQWLRQLSEEGVLLKHVQALSKKGDNKTDAKVIESYYIDSTEDERILLQRMYTSELLQRTSPTPLKFTYRVCIFYYYIKLHFNNIIADDLAILYAIVIAFCDDVLDKKEDTPFAELTYPIDERARIIVSNAIKDSWDAAETEGLCIVQADDFKRPFAFVGISILFHQFEDATIPVPKTSGQSFKYILDSIKVASAAKLTQDTLGAPESGTSNQVFF